MCKNNSFLLNIKSIFLLQICLELTSWAGVTHCSCCLGKVWPLCPVKYRRCQLKQSHHCLSLMKPVEIAKCPRVNPRVSGVEKVNYCKVEDNRIALPLTDTLFRFFPTMHCWSIRINGNYYSKHRSRRPDIREI